MKISQPEGGGNGESPEVVNESLLRRTQPIRSRRPDAEA
jgi:hypothetical protein